MLDPKDYTLFEWIDLWNKAHETDSIPTPVIPTYPMPPLFPSLPEIPDYWWLRRDKPQNDNPPTVTTDHT